MTDPAADELVELNGLHVPAGRVDQFLSGRNGSPLTDEQWDESKRRVAIAEQLGDDKSPTWEALDADDYFDSPGAEVTS